MTITPDLAVANAAKADASRARSARIISIAEGRETIYDLIRDAATADGRHLMRVTIRQLLLAQPGWGPDRAARTIKQFFAVLGTKPIAPRRLTVAWVLDARAGGKRFMAFCDVMADLDEGIWTGFPFAASDQHGSNRGTK